MSYLINQDKKTCYGCFACYNVCPKKAIKMIEDKEGFLYPEIDNSKCIKCNLCKNVCPNNKSKNNFVQEVYAMRLEDKQEMLKSSSGGAFTSIVNAFCDDDYIIFGVEMDSNTLVKHNFINNISDLDKFRKSKYVQSNIGESYKQVLEFLNKNKKVLFSGTPCQVAGLKMFLKKDYDNLLCVDIICHGVPNQYIFNKYLNEVSKKYKSSITSVSFREKVFNYIWNSKNIKIVFSNKFELIENSDVNYYLKGFHKALFYRPSCMFCEFATPKRNSDITIGDCWGIENIDNSISVHEGESVVVINTEKGKKIFNSIKNIKTIKLNLDFVIKSNAQFREPTKQHPKRKLFFFLVNKCGFINSIKICFFEEYAKSKINRLIHRKFNTSKRVK